MKFPNSFKEYIDSLEDKWFNMTPEELVLSADINRIWNDVQGLSEDELINMVSTSSVDVQAVSLIMAEHPEATLGILKTIVLFNQYHFGDMGNTDEVST